MDEQLEPTEFTGCRVLHFRFLSMRGQPVRPCSGNRKSQLFPAMNQHPLSEPVGSKGHGLKAEPPVCQYCAAEGVFGGPIGRGFNSVEFHIVVN